MKTKVSKKKTDISSYPTVTIDPSLDSINVDLVLSPKAEAAKKMFAEKKG